MNHFLFVVAVCCLLRASYELYENSLQFLFSYSIGQSVNIMSRQWTRAVPTYFEVHKSKCISQQCLLIKAIA